jgi:5'-nucleotidase
MDRVRCGKPALFDMDTSLFDYEGAMLRDLRKIAGPNDPPITDNLWELEELHSCYKERMSLIKHQPNWWRDLEPLKLGFRVWDEAKRIGYDMGILTKGPWTHPNAWTEKLLCCKNWLGDDIDVRITTTPKDDTYGYFLYDDYPKFMDAWLSFRPRGWGIMPVTVSNKDYTHPRVIKCTEETMPEVVAKLEELFERIPGPNGPRPISDKIVMV